MAKFRFYAFDKKDWIWTATWDVEPSLLPAYVNHGQGSFDIRGDHGIIVDRFGTVVATFKGTNARKTFTFNAYYKAHYQ